MLVLSRKPHEQTTLPTAGATPQVLQIKGGTVRFGVDAPPDDVTRQRQFRKQVAQRLKAAAMGLGLLRLRLDAGHIDEAYETLTRLQDDLRVFRHRVEGDPESPAPVPRGH
jgi:sRNA-binding carbon storage regulator CsrA